MRILVRCFVAIELDPAARKCVEAALDRCAAAGNDGVRWCRPEQLHITLKFLGETPEPRVPMICDVLRRTSTTIRPFTLELAGLGTFPEKGTPRVMWYGVQDEGSTCRKWLEAADPELEALGLGREQRPFTPHVTLGRAKTPAGGRLIEKLVKAAETPGTVAFIATSVTLFESRGHPHGPRYLPLERVPLGPSLDSHERLD